MSSHRLSWTAASAALIITASACPGSTDNDECDCASHQRCEQGACESIACNTGEQCPAGTHCNDGVCRPGECSDHGDCPGGRCIEGGCYPLECTEDETRDCSTICGSGTESCVSGVWRGCDAPQPRGESCSWMDGGAPEDGAVDGAVDAGAADTSAPDAAAPDTAEPDAGPACQPSSESWCQAPMVLTTVMKGGFYYTCALRSDQTLWCWGDNEHGQLGLGSSGAGADEQAPARIGTSSWSSLGVGLWHACAVRDTGSLYCWGENTFSKLGLGDDLPRTFPTRVGFSSLWYQVVAGRSHTCALKTDGTLWCWGSVELGAPSVDAPMQIEARTDWSSIDTADSHTCGLLNSGALYCWGHNFQGQLGQGDTDSVYTPTRVGLSTTWEKVTTGNYHTCGLRTGEIWCWGGNDDGQLGFGDVAERHSPAKVGSDIDWSTLDAGDRHTCAVKQNGTLWCWGSTNSGRLGMGELGGAARAEAPTRVGTDSDWASVHIGWAHTCAVKQDHSVWCSGNNGDGQLGLGDTTTRWRFTDQCCPLP